MTPTQSPKERGEKMREFAYTVDPNDEIRAGETFEQIACHGDIHVVEYSALTALEHKLEVAIEALERIAERWHAAHPSDLRKYRVEIAQHALATIKGVKTDE